VAYVYAAAGLGVPIPPDRLMLDPSVYTWRLEYEYAVTAWYAGRRAESLVAHQRLLANPELPEIERARLIENLTFFEGNHE
jgi:hypothetical protein